MAQTDEVSVCSGQIEKLAAMALDRGELSVFVIMQLFEQCGGYFRDIGLHGPSPFDLPFSHAMKMVGGPGKDPCATLSYFLTPLNPDESQALESLGELYWELGCQVPVAESLTLKDNVQEILDVA